MQNRKEKQIMPFKTTVNWLFNDMWCYLVIAFLDWKIGVFQQAVVRFNCILKRSTSANFRLDEDVLKTSWRRFSCSSSEDVFKTSWSRRIYSPNSYVFRRRLKDVLKTSWPRSIYLSWPYAFKTSSRRSLPFFRKLEKSALIWGKYALIVIICG